MTDVTTIALGVTGGNQRQAKALMILASFAPDTVQDIVDYVTKRGNSTVDDANTSGLAAVKPFAMLSRNFIEDQDFGSFYTGMCTIMLSSMRNPKLGYKEYSEILQAAFGLPEPYAKELGMQIDTEDPVSPDSTMDGKQIGWFRNLANYVEAGARGATNWFMDRAGLPFHIEQGQEYDVDMMYEWAQLGDIVNKLAGRARLVKARALITANLGIFGQGDAEDQFSDHERTMMKVGTALKPLTYNRIHPACFWAMAPLVQRQHERNVKEVGGLLSAGGYGSPHAHHHRMGSPMLRDAVQGYMSGDPGLLGKLMMGVMNPLSLITNPSVLAELFHGQSGPAPQQVAAHIGDVFGHKMADAYTVGDVEDMLGQLHELGGPLETTGDPNLDAAIIGDVLHEMRSEGSVGDPDAPGTGGLFTRMRINAAIRRGKRRRRRAKRRHALQDAQDYANYTDSPDGDGDEDAPPGEDQDQGDDNQQE